MSEDKGGFIKHNSKHGDKRVDNDEATIESAEKIAENLDGYFTIDYREDGIYLVIVPHKGYGKKVEFKDVKAHIIDRNIENVDFYDLKEKIYESDIKNEVRIADPQKKQDAKLEIRISEDKMKIYATILPPRGMGKWLDYESLISWLKEKGIIYGIKSKTVENLSRRKKQDGYMLVAEGDKPVNGEDAKIKYNFNKDRKIAPTIMEDGMVDHKNLNLIENVTKGQLLAYKIPPQPGKAGKNVFGEKVEPRPGKDVKISGGRNVEISDDGMSCYAACDGQVVYIRNKIDVLPVFEVQGDVGTSTGNIDFLGSVIVKGNVRGGFRI
ncbi:MAG TPA: DUF342 domain-containing protein, partial [Thermoanaerobacterales bacterium]|nr:DUF342 domain-containing protein [Thermoanaerobacterales bacterium]